MATDPELLHAWRAGDRSAGRELFDRHFLAIQRFFHNKVSTGVDDLVQQTFLACIEGRDRFREDASFRTWLFGIAHNKLRMHLRARQGMTDSAIQSVHDLGPSPSQVVAAKAEQRLLLAALRRIPLDLQIALELHFWEQMSGPEIAEALGVPEGTIRTRLRRGRIVLAEQIGALASAPAEASATIERLDAWAQSIRAVVEPQRTRPSDG